MQDAQAGRNVIECLLRYLDKGGHWVGTSALRSVAIGITRKVPVTPQHTMPSIHGHAGPQKLSHAGPQKLSHAGHQDDLDELYEDSQGGISSLAAFVVHAVLP